MLLNNSFTHESSIFSKICPDYNVIHVLSHFFQIAQIFPWSERSIPAKQRCKQPFLDMLCCVNKNTVKNAFEAKETTACFEKTLFEFLSECNV
jgi:hypothetical protein